MKLVAAIICGGTGSRLWPMSCAHRSKPLMAIDETGSFLHQTIKRIESISYVSDIVIVTAKALLTPVSEEIHRASTRQFNTTFILEPSARGTAAAVASAALHCREAHGEDCVMLVLPADHVVKDLTAFDKAVEVAVAPAVQGKLVTFGINPTSAHTGYGYIEVGKIAANGPPNSGWLGVQRFVEKPSRETAEGYIASGDYLWNSGMFCFSAKALLQEMRHCCPEILNACENTMGKSVRIEASQTLFVELDTESFANVPEDSIDIAVMEKSSNIVVVPCEFFWSDIGSWAAIADLAAKDGNGNSGTPKTIFHASSNNYVSGGTREIALVGLNDVIVVDTPGALLVVRKEKAEEVRHVYARSTNSQSLPQGWGTKRILDGADDVKVVKIEIDVGQKISRHDSCWPGASWIVIAGRAELVSLAGLKTTITSGGAHQLEPSDMEIRNIGDGKLILVSSTAGFN
jgi:mannose-1-phosphate guanylyltransferase / mannose-6-phosphate isomerase